MTDLELTFSIAAGIVIGGIALLLLIIVLDAIHARRRERRRSDAANNGHGDVEIFGMPIPVPFDHTDQA